MKNFTTAILASVNRITLQAKVMEKINNGYTLVGSPTEKLLGDLLVHEQKMQKPLPLGAVKRRKVW